MEPDNSPALPQRYSSRAVLGRGGMGEIILAHDEQLGRDVALKAGLVDGHEDLARFVREVRLQGRLEHPAIVPVYDAGTLPDGSPFFTMKRVRGRTLDEVIASLAAGDVEARARFTRARLLALFVTMAQSIHYAHARGVVHRDLKPANVMLGDFGEIYVIDWGIAKLVAEPDSPRRAAHGVLSDDDGGLPTRHGELLGTLGYMAPEQVSDASAVDFRADVYSLGAILFEVLTLERLHPQPRAVEVVQSTLGSCVERIASAFASRALPPELEEACQRATAVRPELRTPTADDLVQAVQRFLDGDRDLAARAKIADEESQRALAALERSLHESESGMALRSLALKHAGRTLALDPTHSVAQEVILRIMVDVPKAQNPPDEVERGVERDFLRHYKRAGLAGVFLYAAWLPVTVGLMFGRPMQPLMLVGWAATVLLAMGLLFANYRTKARKPRLFYLSLAACVFSSAFASRIVGPFVAVPGVITLTAMTFILLGKTAWHGPGAAIGAVGLIGPIVLEQMGWVAPTTTFDDRGMHVASDVVRLSAPASVVALSTGTIMLYVVVMLAASYFHRTAVANARRAALQSWKLSSLVPGDSVTSEPPPSSLLR